MKSSLGQIDTEKSEEKAAESLSDKESHLIDITGDYETIMEAKGKGHLMTEILDSYPNAKISKGTTCVKKEIYKVISDSHEMILKAVSLNMNEEINKMRPERIRGSYEMMKKLGDDHPYFIFALDLREKHWEETVRIEILMENGGESLYDLMKTATNKEIKQWMIQSVEAFMFSEECRISNFDIKPQNMVSKNGHLKIIDLDASVEFSVKSKIFKKLSESNKKVFERTVTYAPMEALKNDGQNANEVIGARFDVYCWGISFYQIITKTESMAMFKQRQKYKDQDEIAYNEFLMQVKNSKELFEMDEKHIIADVIVKCLSYKPEQRPSFNEISGLLLDISKEIACHDADYVSTNMNIGNAYFKYTNNLTKALEYNERALNASLIILGEKNQETATIFNNIALIYNDLDNMKKALEYNEKALNIRLELFGEIHTDTAQSYNNIAAIYDNLGEKKKAFEFHEKALNIFLKLFGEMHEETASYNNIAVIYDELGDKEKALEFNEKALSIRLELLGEAHADTAASYNNIADIYQDLDESKKALEFNEKALSIRLKVFGEEHIDTAGSYNNIAGIYERLGKKKKALEFHERALNIRIKLLGEEHTETAASYNNIGSIYVCLGKKKKALKYLEKALNAYLKTYGEAHEDTAAAYNNIANIYEDFGDSKKALEYNEKALNIRLKVFGEVHADTAQSYNNIAGIYLGLEDKKKALEFYEKALNINLKLSGEDYAETAASYNNIAVVYYSLKDKKTALQNLKKAHEIYLKKLGKHNPRTKKAQEFMKMLTKK